MLNSLVSKNKIQDISGFVLSPTRMPKRSRQCAKARKVNVLDVRRTRLQNALID